jgi:GDP-D-mannose 3',5'-epimerase
LQPQDAYGLEKLASEEIAKHYQTDFGIQTRIARFHNIYGPYGTWKGACRCLSRQKLPSVCANRRADMDSNGLQISGAIASTKRTSLPL